MVGAAALTVSLAEFDVTVAAEFETVTEKSVPLSVIVAGPKV
jgi:hypothetical protein